MIKKLFNFFFKQKEPEILIIERTSSNAFMPVRGTPDSSGLDFFSPIDTVIQPGEDALIPLDIRVKLPKNMDMVFENKSGVATKKKLIRGACVVDETLIKTNKGIFSVLDLGNKEFIENNEIKLFSYNKKSKQTEEKDFSGFVSTGIKECIELKFSDNSILKCAKDHFILTEKGWIMADDLMPEDKIILA